MVFSGVGVEVGQGVGELGELFLGCEEGIVIGEVMGCMYIIRWMGDV